ncbi:MAG: SLC13 family permease [Rickettsiales bacterium]
MALAAAEILPIVVATLCGAVAMVGLGVLNIRQASRAVDPNVVATIGVAMALGIALTETGGAAFIASAFVDAMRGASPAVMLSAFFLMLAVLSNAISTKTTAVLFTPIAIDIALELGVSPEAFAVAVIIGANCSFASPVGYQTSLLVMGPGHYRFVDFTKAGAPLILLLWAVFSLFAPWYYGL